MRGFWTTPPLKECWVEELLTPIPCSLSPLQSPALPPHSPLPKSLREPGISQAGRSGAGFWFLASCFRTAALIHGNHFLFSSSVQRVQSCWEKKGSFLWLGWKDFSPSSLSAPHPRYPPVGASFLTLAPAAPLSPGPCPLCFFFRLPQLLPPSSLNLNSPSGVPEGGASGRLEMGEGPLVDFCPLIPGHHLRVRSGRTCMAIALPLPPKGAAGRSPPLGQLNACSPEGGWAGGPDLPRGHGGLCLGNGVWEGGIYRLLFTKTRPP